MRSIEPVRLLILETSQNRAEELIVLLRTHGRATRAQPIDSLEDLRQKLKDQTWDLLIGVESALDVTLEESIQVISELEKDVPVILIAEDENPARITQGLDMGAKDVALKNDKDRLVMIIDRELDNLAVRRQLRTSKVRLQETERRNQLLLAGSTHAIAYVHEGMHIYTNETYRSLFGYEDPDDLTGIPIVDLIASSDQDKFKLFLKSYNEPTRAGEPHPQAFNCMTEQNASFTAGLTLTPTSYDGEYCTQVMFKTQDAELERRLKEAASQDLQTGLFSRSHFINQLDQALNEARRGAQSRVLFYIRIDNYVDLQTEAGISTAESAIGNLAELIRAYIDDTHLIAKFGDDVFTMLYRSGDRDAALTLGKEICHLIDETIIEVSGKSFHATASIGMALMTENTPGGEEIISRAHQAAMSITLGNDVKFHQTQHIDPDEDGQSQSAQNIKEMLQDALSNDTLKLLYQPIVSLRGDQTDQYEALVRLLDDHGNEMRPAQFLSIADQAGLLEKIDRWVISHAITAIAEARQSAEKTRLFVNITHKSMVSKEFLPWMIALLKAVELPEEAVIFQLHENDATTYLKHATRFSKEAAALGCQISINHFGCSLHPFNLLKHLTPNYVKLDGSFAGAIESNAEKQEELITMVRSLQDSGVLTAISGVESPTVLPTLWKAGLDFIQGHNISLPLDVMDFDFDSEVQ